MSEGSAPVRVFLCHAREDRELRIRLESHLSLLVRNGAITIWHEEQVLPGEDCDSVVDAEIGRADIILLLISASFLQSNDCCNVRMSQALERHARSESVVIPILLRPVAWEDAPFSELVSLPGNRLAATLWRDIDEAFRDIVLGIRWAVAACRLREPFGLPNAYAENRRSLDMRRVDAAVPANVIVREPTEILAMVATSSSDGLRAWLRLDPLSFPVTPEDVRSSQFELAFPVDEHGRRQAATVTVAVESRDSEPPLTFKKILVPPTSDSAVCTLFVTPMRAGTLPLQMEVRLGDVTVWSLRLRTNAMDAGTPRSPGYVLASVPLSTVSLDRHDGRGLGGDWTTTPRVEIPRIGGKGGVDRRRVLVGFLVSFQDNPSGQFWRLWEGENIVGRRDSDEDVDVPIAHDTISAEHAVVECDGNNITLFDLGSANGTFINEKALSPGIRRGLRDLDHIRFGGYTVLIAVIAARLSNPCPCGSGAPFEKCHGADDEEPYERTAL